MRGYVPDFVCNIEFGPFSLPKFSWAGECEREKLQGEAHFRGAIVATDSAQDASKPGRVDDRRTMSHDRCRQGALQCSDRIGVGSARRNGVTEYLADDRTQAPRGFVAASAFHLSQRGEDFRGRD